MPLIVTPGAANADSYATVVEFKAYCDARGISYPADTVIEQRLRKGADYLVTVYRDRWAGTRTSTTQALDWPRYDVPMKDGPGYGEVASYYPNDEIPEAVKRANIEAANRAATDLIPDQTQGVKRKRVGEIEVEYQDHSREVRTFKAIDQLLAPFLTAGNGVRISRS